MLFRVLFDRIVQNIVSSVRADRGAAFLAVVRVLVIAIARDGPSRAMKAVGMAVMAAREAQSLIGRFLIANDASAELSMLIVARGKDDAILANANDEIGANSSIEDGMVAEDVEKDGFLMFEEIFEWVVAIDVDATRICQVQHEIALPQGIRKSTTIGRIEDAIRRHLLGNGRHWR